MAINVSNSVTPGFAALSGYSYGTENRRRRDQDIQIQTLAEQERLRMAREQQDEAVRQFDANFGQRQYEFDTNLVNSNQKFAANIASQVGLTNLASQNRMREKVFGNKLDLESDRINRDAQFSNSMKQMQEQENLYKQRYEQRVLFDKQVKEQQKNEIINDITQNPEKYDLLEEEIPDVIAQLNKGISLDKIPTMASRFAEEERLNLQYPEGQRVGQVWEAGGNQFTRLPDNTVKSLGKVQKEQTMPTLNDWQIATNIAKNELGVDPDPAIVRARAEEIIKNQYPAYSANATPNRDSASIGALAGDSPTSKTPTQLVMPGTVPVDQEISQNKQVAKERVAAIQTNQKVAETIQRVVTRATDTKNPLTNAQKYKLSQLTGRIENAKDLNERDNYLKEFDEYVKRLEEKFDAADYWKK